MKFNKIFCWAAGAAIALAGTGCSSNYLDLEPQGSIEYEELETEEAATLAVYGMCQSMYKQYSSLSGSTVWFNGEPWTALFYGDVQGQDFVSAFWFDDVNLMSWLSMNRSSSSGAAYAWNYYYGLISQANNLITFTHKVTNEADEVLMREYGYNENHAFNPVPDVDGLHAFRYAQALCIRAHSYTRLLQIYGSRWEDRYDNATGQFQNTVPLRLEFQDPEGDLSMPLAKWDVLVNQIYADLNQAITLFQASGSQRTYDWEPNLQVAQGLVARVAMINHDFPLAQEMANSARTGFDLMSMTQYQEGFAEPNSEWMWTNSGSSQGMYYYSFGATNACNGAYPCAWGTIGAGGISNDLINQSIPLDQRAVLYYSPRNRANNIKTRFWGSEVNSENLNVNGSYGALHSDFVEFCQTRYAAVADKGWAPPYTYTGFPFPTYTICAATFGAQFKFWGTDTYSASYFPFMRASEMILIEAEAAYYQDNQTLASQLLTEINKERIRNYNRTYSGEELLNQIKLCRRIELWGEGFSWFDLKRWNEPLERRAWVRGDDTSGNWPLAAAYSFDTSVNRGWRWRIPTSELNMNRAIDYTEATGGNTDESDDLD